MRDPIVLDPYQRTVLANQYRILHHLEPTEGWDRRQEVMENGYEIEYEFENSEPLSFDDSREIYDILDMFVSLDLAIKGLSPVDVQQVTPDLVTFDGFDGNHESKHLGYLHHLWETDRWVALQPAVAKQHGNSHFPTLDRYRKMLAEHKKSADPHALTLADILRIQKA